MKDRCLPVDPHHPANRILTIPCSGNALPFIGAKQSYCLSRAHDFAMRWMPFTPSKATLILLFTAAWKRVTTTSEGVSALPDARIVSATEELNDIADDITDAEELGGHPEDPRRSVEDVLALHLWDNGQLGEPDAEPLALRRPRQSSTP